MPSAVPQPAAPSPDAAAGATHPLTDDQFNGLVSAVTAAFGDPTRREIYLFAREAGSRGVTAAEIAGRFALHPNVARHHLEKLANGGYLVVELDRAREREVRAGRPSKRYRAAEQETGLEVTFRRDDVLASLLARALDALGPEQAETLADEAGYEYGRQLAKRMDPNEGQRTARSALAAVAEALTAHGFAAHAEEHQGSLTIVAECCPFGSTAQEYPHVMCALDRGMIRGMLSGLYGETTPRFEESRPVGDEHCVARV